MLAAFLECPDMPTALNKAQHQMATLMESDFCQPEQDANHAAGTGGNEYGP